MAYSILLLALMIVFQRFAVITDARPESSGMGLQVRPVIADPTQCAIKPPNREFVPCFRGFIALT